MRINKYLAGQNICSRREADELIAKKKVYVNGRLAEIGQQISDTDVVELKRGFTQNYEYFAYNKPRGVITHSPGEHEEDIASSIGRTDIFPIGRLDKDSEGLIILTNDRKITKNLLGPESLTKKEYHVTVDKPLAQNVIEKLKAGVDIEGYMTKKCEAKKLQTKVVSITLTEGKKHQVRRMLAALGYTTLKLRRVRFGNIKIDGLKPNELRALNKKEVDSLLLS